MLAVCPAAVTFLFLGTTHYVAYPGYSLKLSKTQIRNGASIKLSRTDRFFFQYKTMISI